MCSVQSDHQRCQKCGERMKCVNPIELDAVDEDGDPIIVCGGCPVCEGEEE